MTVPIYVRVLAVVVAVISLITGIWVGLTRIGWALGSPPASDTHSPILVLGFLGTVIGMERAVAMGRSWAWITPFTAAGAAIAMLLGAPYELIGSLLLVSGVVLVLLFGVAYSMQPEMHMVLMGFGAGAWVLAAATWLTGRPVIALIPWLAAFLILTIAGERLELARMIATSERGRRRLAASVGVVLAGSVIAWMNPQLGARIAGFGNLLVALWLIRYDVARRTIRLTGVTRYMASGLLVGYVWLGVSSILWIYSGLNPASLSYDAAIHTLFLGFVLSMIMAHAPIVIPALAGLPFPYTSLLWIPLVAFQFSVMLRVIGGLSAWFDIRKWGAMFNAVFLGIFLAMVIVSVIRGQVQKRVL